MRKLAVLLMLFVAVSGVFVSHTLTHNHTTATPTVHIGSSGFNADGTCPSPPAGDHRALSDAELAMYGLPPRDSKLFASVNKMTTRICQGVIAPDAQPHGGIRPLVTSYNTSDDSGFHYVNWGNSGSATRLVELDGEIIADSINNSSTPNGSGVWFNAVLGGNDTTATSPACPSVNYGLRAGVSERRNTTTSFAYAATIQDVGDDTNPVDAFYLNSNTDDVEFTVRYDPWGPDNDSYGYMIVSDVTSGQYSSYHNTKTPTGCVGSWTASRWFSDPIANFTSRVFFINGLLENDATHDAKFNASPLNTLHVRWVMKPSSTQLVHPDSDISSSGNTGSFSEYWDAAS